jgi:DNA-directed RNA polymerase subunit RPC12/RpoP
VKKARRLYRCAHCGKRVFRVSAKQWIASLCGASGRMVRLVLLHKRSNVRHERQTTARAMLAKQPIAARRCLSARWRG